MQKINLESVYEVTWKFDDGREKTFRTDEWDEAVLKERVTSKGIKIVDEQRKQVR